MKKIKKRLKYLKLKILLKLIEKELKQVLDKINEKDTNKFINLISKSKGIFLTGQGRSGLVAEAFAMRLMQLGLKSYIMSEATTPKITKKDLLIAVSGSGKTKLTEDIVKESKKAGAKICLVTANKNTQMARKSNLVIEIKAKTKLDHRKSIEPLGSLFEQATFLYLDSLVLMFMKKLKRKESFLRKRHAIQ